MNNYSPRGFNFLPPVVKNLIIINIICFLISLVLEKVYGININSILGLHFFKGSDFHFFQYFSYMFLHANFSHLFFNMFALWMFGYLLENAWGSKRFLIFYLVTGLGAGLTNTVVNGIEYYNIQSAINTYAQNPSVDSFISLVSSKFKGYYSAPELNQMIQQWRYSPNDASFIMKSVDVLKGLLDVKANIPTIGASGSVFGILLAFGMMFPNQLIIIYFLIPIKAKWLVTLYGILELVSGIMSTNDGIAHFAHLGGMLFGYFLIRYWRKDSFTRWD